MKKKIIFYAPLGKDTPPEKIGGAEAGCIKTKRIYEKAGIEVKIIEKPAISRGKIRFIVEMAWMPLRFFFTMLFLSKNVPVHIVGFYTKIAAFELFLVEIARLTKHKVIYELRNGSMIFTYKEGTLKYRRVLKKLLLKPDIVLCQGKEYVDFIRETWNVERSYYPNYIMDDFVQPNNLFRPRPIKLIYFGRVTESKNIDVIIDTLGCLRRNGLDAYLEIIGGYNEDYRKILDKKVADNMVVDRVVFYGRQLFSFIVEHLRFSHYFVFPSTEKQEGHSNSLTEAMGCGVVPVVSIAGFNESICGSKDLIVKDLDGVAFANRIMNIEKTNNWKIYSEFVYSRVIDNYTQSIVGKNLLSYIEPLYK